jgi:hypothetical protein
MDRRWVIAALLVGLAYFVIGRAFAGPTTHVQFWRLAAWVVSGVAYAAQIGYEHFALRSSPRALAFHAAAAAAVGAFALAVAGFLHSLAGTPATHLWLLALIVWPVVTAIPAFVVALVVALVLRRSESHSA